MKNVFQWMRGHPGGMFVSLLGLGMLWAISAHNVMDRRAKYTIGYITGSHQTFKSGREYNFRYQVAGISYKGSAASGPYNEAEGTPFLVKYDSIDPQMNCGYDQIAIPTRIRQAPANGWVEPPFPVPKRIVDRGKP